MADLTTFLQAVILGVVEGVTEFIPVSSTGHLILAGHLIGFEGAVAGTFEVVIQLGAILAVCVLYFERLLRVVVRLPYDPAARRFVLALLAAFLPSVVLGALLHDVIKEVLFSPWVVVVSLVLGGIAILAIEAVSPEPRQHSAEGMPVALALKIGFCQVISMVPGVSRSGATILGAVLLGVDRKAAAEFSFFLAIPTMMAASAYDLYKSSGALAGSDFAVIAVGFVVSLITAVIVIRAFLAFLVRHTFRAFGWYRIGAGIAMAVVLLLEGGPQEPPVTSPPEPAALLAPASGDRPRLSVDSPTPSEVRVESSVGLSTEPELIAAGIPRHRHRDRGRRAPAPAGPEPHHPAGAVEQDRTRGRRQSEIGPERAGVAGAVTCRDVALGHRHLGTGPAGRSVDRLARHEVTAPAEAAHHVERGVARLQQADAAPLVGRHHPREAVFVVACDPDPAQPIHHAAAHQQRVGGDRHGRAADHPGEQIPLARRRLRHHGPDRARDQLRRLLRRLPCRCRHGKRRLLVPAAAAADKCQQSQPASVPQCLHSGEGA